MSYSTQTLNIRTAVARLTRLSALAGRRVGLSRLLGKRAIRPAPYSAAPVLAHGLFEAVAVFQQEPALAGTCAGLREDGRVDIVAAVACNGQGDGVAVALLEGCSGIVMV